jgi:hypothetical protein
VQAQGPQPAPARVWVETNGQRVTFAITPAGLHGDARLLLAVGLIGCAVLCGAGIAIGFQDQLASDLRVVGTGCFLVAGACVFVVCAWEALKAARARAIVTLDGDTLTVQELGLTGGPTYRWRKSELRSLAVGDNVGSAQRLFPFTQAARGSERVLWLTLATGDQMPLLGSCGLGEELPWLASALSRRLGILDISEQQMELSGAVWNAAGVGPMGSNEEVVLNVDAATAVAGGRISMSLRREDGPEQKVEIVLPQGVPNGKRLRLRGLGTGGKDLYVRVKIGKPA